MFGFKKYSNCLLLRLKIIVTDFLKSLNALLLSLFFYVRSLAVSCLGQIIYFVIVVQRVAIEQFVYARGELWCTTMKSLMKLVWTLATFWEHLLFCGHVTTCSLGHNHVFRQQRSQKHASQPESTAPCLCQLLTIPVPCSGNHSITRTVSVLVQD